MSTWNYSWKLSPQTLWGPSKYFPQYLHFIHIDPEKKQNKYFFFMVHASNIFNWEFSQLFALQSSVHFFCRCPAPLWLIGLMTGMKWLKRHILTLYKTMPESLQHSIECGQWQNQLEWNTQGKQKYVIVHTWVKLILDWVMIIYFIWRI